MNPVYLDWNATTPPLLEVIDAVHQTSLEAWGNSSSVHFMGNKARRVLEDARDRIATLMECQPFDVIFTSGGTEANNLALRAHLARVDHVICSRLEHPSVLRVVESAEKDHAIDWVPVDHRGRIRPDLIESFLEKTPAPALVVLQAVNHETGVIHPVQEVIRRVHEHGSLIHVDAVQAVGKVEGCPWRDADTVTVSAHKIRGPKGIGALIGGSCQSLRPLLLGGPQERKLRPGTVSVPLAVGFGVASIWARRGPSRYDGIRVLRDRLEHALLQLGAQRNGEEPRVPHVTSVSFEELRGDELVAALDVEGVCLSSGSACSAGSPEASSVVEAMHDSQRAQRTIRASLGDETTQEEIDQAIQVIRTVIDRAGNG